MKCHLSLACVAILSLAAASCAVVQEAQEVAPPAGQDPSPEDMAAAMEAYMKVASPGPHHEHLKPFAGQWTTAGKFRMTPEQPWEESAGEGELELVLGSRFLHQHYHGEPMAGMPTPFEGIGYIGYDQQQQKYVSCWMDNMGTMIMTGEGSCEAGGKTITLRSSFIDPMTSQETHMKSVYALESPERYKLMMYGPAPDGTEFLMMEIVHTRKQ